MVRTNVCNYHVAEGIDDIIMERSFLHPSLLAELKRVTFSELSLAWEEGLGRNQQLLNKGRLNAYLGMHGFGYRGVWMDPGPLFPALVEVMALIKARYQADINGAMVTAWPPATSEAAAQSKQHGVKRLFMAAHQDNNISLGLLEDVVVFGLTIYLPLPRTTASVTPLKSF